MTNSDAELTFRAMLDGILDDILQDPSEHNFDIAEQMIKQYRSIMTKDED